MITAIWTGDPRRFPLGATVFVWLGGAGFYWVSLSPDGDGGDYVHDSAVTS